jgi:hypothetical protein
MFKNLNEKDKKKISWLICLAVICGISLIAISGLEKEEVISKDESDNIAQEDINSEDFIGVMIIFCDTLKKIFDKKTDADCCVSIKVPISVGESLESLELQNLCRDSSHRNRDTEQYKNIKHRIIGNTAYSLIVDNILKGNQKRLAYVNNNIPNSANYINTSIECYPDGILPYSSELVYPIVPIKGNETNQKDLKGFICIDCNKPNKFDESRYDIPMVQGVADGIYDIFANRNNG